MSKQENQDLLAVEAANSDEVRSRFRRELVNAAFNTYKELLLDEDPKVRKAAADSIMKIEGSLQPQASQASQGNGISINFDMGKLQSLATGMEKIANGRIIDINQIEE